MEFFKPNKKQQYTFGGTFLAGILTHGYMLTNKISFHDDICSLFGLGTTWKSGRWGLGIIELLLENTLGIYSMSFWEGLLCLFFIAATAVLVVDILDIEDEKFCFLIGAIMTAFPSVMAILMFMFTSGSYFFALFLIVFAIWVAEKYKYGFILSVPCISFSLGIYQAFFGVGITILILLFIGECASNEFNIKKFLLKVTKYVVTESVGLAFYLVIVKVSIRLVGVNITSYSGIDSMMSLSLGKRIKRVLLCYTDLVEMLLHDSNGLAGNVLMQVVLLVMGIVLLGCMYLLIKCVKSVTAKTILVMLVLSLPIGINIIFPMTSEKTVVHALMRYSLVFLWITVLYLVILIQKEYQRVAGMLQKIAISVTIVSIIFYGYYSNIAYMKVHFLQEQTTSYYTTLITQIKSCEGYRDELPIAYVGMGKIEDATLAENSQYKTSIELYKWDLKEWINDFAYVEYMSNHCGFSPKILSVDEIKEWREIDEMPIYPDDGAIKVVDGNVIVKFAEREVENTN